MTNISFKHLACDACGNDSPRKICAAIASQALADTNVNASGVAVARCEVCGFYYSDPMPFCDYESDKNIYDHGYFDEQLTDWWKRVRTHNIPRRRFDFIERYKAVDSPVFLEVGCGKGCGMTEAARRGWRVYGQDVTDVFATEIKDKLGVEIYVGELKNAGFQNGYFDIVYLDSVIEHVPQPAAMLTEIKSILKPNGLVYIVTPNASALIHKFRNVLCKLLKRKNISCLSPFEPPYHITGFTKRSFKIMCEKNGFEIKYLKICSGKNEWRKFGKKNWRLRLIHLFYFPIYLIGEVLGRGITIEAAISSDNIRL